MSLYTGAAQADCALLVVNATNGEFETGFDLGGQTREHTLLIRSLGMTCGFFNIRILVHTLKRPNQIAGHSIAILLRQPWLQSNHFKTFITFITNCLI